MINPAELKVGAYICVGTEVDEIPPILIFVTSITGDTIVGETLEGRQKVTVVLGPEFEGGHVKLKDNKQKPFDLIMGPLDQIGIKTHFERRAAELSQAVLEAKANLEGFLQDVESFGKLPPP